MSGAQHTALIEVVQLVVRAGAAAAQRKSMAKEAEANIQMQAQEAALTAKIREMEINAQHQKGQLQASVISQIIDACKHVEDRKFDLILEAFRSTHSLLAEQQKALIEQKKDLSRQLSEIDATKEVRKFVHLRKGMTEISNELEDIRRSSQMMQLQLQMFTKEIGVNFRLPALPVVY